WMGRVAIESEIRRQAAKTGTTESEAEVVLPRVASSPRAQPAPEMARCSGLKKRLTGSPSRTSAGRRRPSRAGTRAARSRTRTAPGRTRRGCRGSRSRSHLSQDRVERVVVGHARGIVRPGHGFQGVDVVGLAPEHEAVADLAPSRIADLVVQQ